MGRSWVGAAVVWWCIVMTGHAQSPPAGDDVARNLFEAGRAAYDSGNYEDALSFFEQAQARSPRPQLLYNIGQAADRLRDDARALASFKAYIAALPDAPNRVEVENRIRALERKSSAAPAATAAPATRTSEAASRPNDAPTPAQTAAAASTIDTASSPDATTRADVDDDSGVTSKWWFWTAIGAVAAAAVITTVALSSSDTTQPTLQGNSGVSVQALWSAP